MQRLLSIGRSTTPELVWIQYVAVFHTNSNVFYFMVESIQVTLETSILPFVKLVSVFSFFVIGCGQKGQDCPVLEVSMARYCCSTE